MFKCSKKLFRAAGEVNPAIVAEYRAASFQLGYVLIKGRSQQWHSSGTCLDDVVALAAFISLSPLVGNGKKRFSNVYLRVSVSAQSKL